MNNILLALFCCLFLAACSKKDDTPAPTTTSPGTTNPPTSTNPYYFRFKLDGQAYNMTSPVAQYLSSDDRYAGGFMNFAVLTLPSIKLGFGYDSVVTDAMMKALAGKTFYFDGENPKISLDFDSTFNGEIRYAVDTPDHNFYVKVNTISYLKKDTTVFNPVAVYVINGTCRGVVQDYASRKKQLITEGEFNFLISRVDDK